MNVASTYSTVILESSFSSNVCYGLNCVSEKDALKSFPTVPVNLTLVGNKIFHKFPR